MRKMLLICFLIYVLAACGEGDRKDAVVQRIDVRGVSVEKVRVEELQSYYKTSGSVKAETVSMISSKVIGAVTSILVKNGDRVKKGQLLMTIDDADVLQKVRASEAAYQAALNGRDAAEENFNLAESTYLRFKKLFEEHALTPQEMNEVETKKNVAYSQFKQAEAMMNQSEAVLKEAKVFLSYTGIKSPIYGIVSEKKIDVGTMASPGMHLITIEDPSLYVIHVNVDERLFSRVKKGMHVKVMIASLHLELEGVVSEISQAVDPGTRTFLVKIAVDGEGMRSGFFANVMIPEGTVNAVLVPAGSVVKKGQLRGVYVVDENGVLNFRLIKTGSETNGWVTVLAGLSGTESIIVSGIHRAVDGGIISNSGGSEKE